MNPPLNVTRGRDAFELLADAFARIGDQESRGAIDAFLLQIQLRTNSLIYEPRTGGIPLHQASLGQDGEDEFFFRVGSFGVDALSARALYRDGVLLLADRWGDDLQLSVEADAPFEQVAEWPTLSS